MNGADIIAIVILVAIVIAIVVYLLHWLYRHSSKDLSFVRTGFGGNGWSWAAARWFYPSCTTSPRSA